VDELPFGKQLQIDFGEYKTPSGLKLYIFGAVLSGSRYKFIAFQDKPFTTLDLIFHLMNCFDYIEGMPEEIVIGQDSVMVVAENHGDIIYTKDFAYFIQEMGLRMYVCRKANPETKGKVENCMSSRSYLKTEPLTSAPVDQKRPARWRVRTVPRKLRLGMKFIAPKALWASECGRTRPERHIIGKKRTYFDQAFSQSPFRFFTN